MYTGAAGVGEHKGTGRGIAGKKKNLRQDKIKTTRGLKYISLSLARMGLPTKVIDTGNFGKI